MSKNKVEFEIKKGDLVIKLWAVKPDIKTQQKAQIYRAKRFAELAKGGAMLETELRRLLEKKEIFDENKRKELEEIDERIQKNEKIVTGKDKTVTKSSKMREAAISLRIDRMLRIQLLSEYTSLQNQTAESMSDDDKFSFLVANCVLYADSDKPYFKSLEEYLERGGDEDAQTCAQKYASIFYGLDENFDAKLPENEFLRKYNMCDEKLRLVDNKGRLINYEGKLINEDGELVDENGVVIPKPKEEELLIENDWKVGETPKVEDKIEESPKELEVKQESV